MGYKNAAELLPTHLLEELQKYIEGGLIYVPKNSEKVGWGCTSGARESISHRNREIYTDYSKGITVELLANKYYLSTETIKKIVYGKKSKA